jgi:hypothetical protein
MYMCTCHKHSGHFSPRFSKELTLLEYAVKRLQKAQNSARKCCCQTTQKDKETCFNRTALAARELTQPSDETQHFTSQGQSKVLERVGLRVPSHRIRSSDAIRGPWPFRDQRGCTGIGVSALWLPLCCITLSQF